MASSHNKSNPLAHNAKSKKLSGGSPRHVPPRLAHPASLGKAAAHAAAVPPAPVVSLLPGARSFTESSWSTSRPTSARQSAAYNPAGASAREPPREEKGTTRRHRDGEKLTWVREVRMPHDVHIVGGHAERLRRAHQPQEQHVAADGVVQKRVVVVLRAGYLPQEPRLAHRARGQSSAQRRQRRHSGCACSNFINDQIERLVRKFFRPRAPRRRCVAVGAAAAAG